MPKTDDTNVPIGERLKKNQMAEMTGEEAKIFEWTHGKSRNIRALLCSLDTVVWEGSRWKKCGMHQLVTHDDVKKMYRKACLSILKQKTAKVSFVLVITLSTSMATGSSNTVLNC